MCIRDSAGGGFALARRGGADGGDEDQLALFFGIVNQAVIDLGLVAAIGDHVLIGKAQLCLLYTSRCV